MTRDEYLKIKAERPVEIIYEYYKEKFNSAKHSPFLGIKEFFIFFQMYTDVNAMFNKVSNYYDGKFNVIELRDAEGKTIGYV